MYYCGSKEKKKEHEHRKTFHKSSTSADKTVREKGK